MDEKTTTEWTALGYRILAEVTPNGAVILSLHSRALTAAKDTPPARIIWVMSQLAVPQGTARAEAGRLVEHWLSFYGDEDVKRLGLTAFQGLFDAVPELSGSATGPGGGQGGLN